jgi:hypothetical protein
MTLAEHVCGVAVCCCVVMVTTYTGVREQSALAFQTLHGILGSRAIEEVVPSLLRYIATLPVTTITTAFN